MRLEGREATHPLRAGRRRLARGFHSITGDLLPLVLFAPPAVLRLRLHTAKCVIRRTDEGLPFLGYVAWPGRIRVRGQTVRRFRRRMRKRTEGGSDERRQALAAWRGHVRLAGSYRSLETLGDGHTDAGDCPRARG